MTLTFQGQWRHRLLDHSIPYRQPFPICFFRQFVGKTHRLATMQTLQTTDRRQADTIHTS